MIDERLRFALRDALLAHLGLEQMAALRKLPPSRKFALLRQVELFERAAREQLID